MSKIRYPNASCNKASVPQSDHIFFLYRQDLPDRSSYSVAAWDEPNHTIVLAEDVTDNLDIAEHFLVLLLQENVAPCHLVDILEDSLPLR